MRNVNLGGSFDWVEHSSPNRLNAASQSLATDIDPEIVKALHWCRLGRVRPQDDSAFHRAKQHGLLAQDSTWRATDRGEGVLIALGLLEGKPTPAQTRLVVLWAACENFPRAQFVTAWSDGLDECFPTEAERVREEAERWWRDWGDEHGWRFWTSRVEINTPEAGIDHGDEPRQPL